MICVCRMESHTIIDLTAVSSSYLGLLTVFERQCVDNASYPANSEAAPQHNIGIMSDACRSAGLIINKV